MNPAAAPPYNAPVVEKLLKSHSELLHGRETVLAALRGGSIDRVQPAGLFGRMGSVGRKMGQSLGEDEIERREAQAQLFLRRRGLDLVEFEATKVGYTLGLTQLRVMVFTFNGRQHVSESQVLNMRLEQLHHNDEHRTLFFCEGRQAAAVTSWEDPEITELFVRAYQAVHAAVNNARLSRRAS